MLELFIDRVSKWNPQLARELKARLTWPNIAIATVISILFQTITFIVSDWIRIREMPRWWLTISELLDKEIWLALAIGGTYLIAADFDRNSAWQTYRCTDFDLLGGLFSLTTSDRSYSSDCQERAP
jgi:hypothetical protein